MVRREQTFKADPLSTSTTGIHFPIWSGLLWSKPPRGKSLLVKEITSWDWVGVISPTSCSGDVSTETLSLLRAWRTACLCLWEATSKPQMETLSWSFFSCLRTGSSFSSSGSSVGTGGYWDGPGWSLARWGGLKCLPARVRWTIFVLCQVSSQMASSRVNQVSSGVALGAMWSSSSPQSSQQVVSII